MPQLLGFSEYREVSVRTDFFEYKNNLGVCYQNWCANDQLDFFQGNMSLNPSGHSNVKALCGVVRALLSAGLLNRISKQ